MTPPATHADLMAALAATERRMTVRGAAGLSALAAFLVAIRFFGP